MKIKLLLLVFFTSLFGYTQDTIFTYKERKIACKVTSISNEKIFYALPEWPKEADLSISKNEVFEIKYSDGKMVDFISDSDKNISVDELKKHILDLINQYGYDEDSDKKRYVASFEGDHLRLKLTSRDGLRVNQGFLFEFYDVIAFHEVSKRSKNEAYVNIWLHFLDYPESKNKWAKQKLIMKVKGHEHAEDILKSLKLYNRILVDQKRAKK